MVRSLLRTDNPKTQTRRVIKPQPEYAQGDGTIKRLDEVSGPAQMIAIERLVAQCRYGKPGDVLWVREAAIPDFPKEFSYYDWTWAEVPEEYRIPKHVLYRASWTGTDLKWHPSIHLPRWASRISLRLTDVRVEQIQDISDYDCHCEGIDLTTDDGENYRSDFQQLWDGINGKTYPWIRNPWIWALSFERI